MLPNDSFMLLSFINTKLRDEFKSLDDLCKVLCVDKQNIISKLSDIGFEYNIELNQFK